MIGRRPIRVGPKCFVGVAGRLADMRIVILGAGCAVPHSASAFNPGNVSFRILLVSRPVQGIEVRLFISNILVASEADPVNGSVL